MATSDAPVAIKVDRQAKRVNVTWSDGSRSSYPWFLLRARCPSASERVSRDEQNPLAILAKKPSSDLVDVRAVGSYAISFTWADGHNAGIYTWEFLRELAQDPAVESLPTT